MPEVEQAATPPEPSNVEKALAQQAQFNQQLAQAVTAIGQRIDQVAKVAVDPPRYVPPAKGTPAYTQQKEALFDQFLQAPEEVLGRTAAVAEERAYNRARQEVEELKASLQAGAMTQQFFAANPDLGDAQEWVASAMSMLPAEMPPAERLARAGQYVRGQLSNLAERAAQQKQQETERGYYASASGGRPAYGGPPVEQELSPDALARESFEEDRKWREQRRQPIMTRKPG